ncbi:PREDICTED: uncharacterized protein LOC106340963 isoform X1 [Brassica oleracea var. oleracea]|uniref:uncharacterized protein LOC106340963 isoform X1 n=1 Tax=Brassica oleracea var. oleracea TaxID=109376 RepID=UPI0006A6E0FA|nr:PREDICTED: uncharacterized protein LOC106340963 isoform X1 [Brassica oleracea var. oleracea]
MDKKKSVSGSSSSSSSSSFDHLFGPRNSSSSSSSTTGLFQSIFPPPATGAQADLANRNGAAKYEHPNFGISYERGEMRKNKEKKNYQNEETQPPCNLSSSIYYGGQENYPSSTPPQSTNNPDAMEGKAILKVHQEETGGKARFITSYQFYPMLHSINKGTLIR